MLSPLNNIATSSDLAMVKANGLPRYADFLVNEINADGEVVRLTSLTAGSSEADQEAADPGAAADASGSAAPSSSQADLTPCSGSNSVPDWSEVDELVGTAGCAAVRQYFDQIAAYEKFQCTLARGEAKHAVSCDQKGFIHKPPSSIDLPFSGDKAARTAVHQFFKRPSLPRLSTETITGAGGSTSIRLSYHAQVMGYAHQAGCVSQQLGPFAEVRVDCRRAGSASGQERATAGAATLALGHPLRRTSAALPCTRRTWTAAAHWRCWRARCAARPAAWASQATRTSAPSPCSRSPHTRYADGLQELLNG